VQFGPDHYCANRFSGLNPKKIDIYGSKTAEIAMYDNQGRIIRHPDQREMVMGWMTADHVIEYSNWLMSLKPEDENIKYFITGAEHG
jgi:hypothetical protein